MSFKILTSLFNCKKFLLLILISNFVAGNVEDNEVSDAPEYHIIQGVKVYQGDRQCRLLGGLCVHSSDCNTPTTTKGLCPSNSHRGVECCYELPIRPAPCAQHFGECMTGCPKYLTRPGTDCPNGQTCCILI